MSEGGIVEKNLNLKGGATAALRLFALGFNPDEQFNDTDKYRFNHGKDSIVLRVYKTGGGCCVRGHSPPVEYWAEMSYTGSPETLKKIEDAFFPPEEKQGEAYRKSTGPLERPICL